MIDSELEAIDDLEEEEEEEEEEAGGGSDGSPWHRKPPPRWRFRFRSRFPGAMSAPSPRSTRSGLEDLRRPGLRRHPAYGRGGVADRSGMHPGRRVRICR